MDEAWPLEQQRRFVSETVELYSWRGTTRGLVGLVRIYSGVEPEVSESGGAAWSPAPATAAPGRSEPGVTVTLRVADPNAVDLRRLDAIVAAATPAHIQHQIEVLAR